MKRWAASRVGGVVGGDGDEVEGDGDEVEGDGEVLDVGEELCLGPGSDTECELPPPQGMRILQVRLLVKELVLPFGRNECLNFFYSAAMYVMPYVEPNPVLECTFKMSYARLVEQFNHVNFLISPALRGTGRGLAQLLT
ncbi:hypothetical protein OSTOST_21966, partial [Ostertagia ostertagi]